MPDDLTPQMNAFLDKVAEARGRIPSLTHDRAFEFAKAEAAE